MDNDGGLLSETLKGCKAYSTFTDTFLSEAIHCSVIMWSAGQVHGFTSKVVLIRPAFWNYREDKDGDWTAVRIMGSSDLAKKPTLN